MRSFVFLIVGQRLLDASSDESSTSEDQVDETRVWKPWLEELKNVKRLTENAQELIENLKAHVLSLVKNVVDPGSTHMDEKIELSKALEKVFVFHIDAEHYDLATAVAFTAFRVSLY